MGALTELLLAKASSATYTALATAETRKQGICNIEPAIPC